MSKYKPSNGEEGIAFEEDFCLQCEHDRAAWKQKMVTGIWMELFLTEMEK